MNPMTSLSNNIFAFCDFTLELFNMCMKGLNCNNIDRPEKQSRSMSVVAVESNGYGWFGIEIYLHVLIYYLVQALKASLIGHFINIIYKTLCTFDMKIIITVIIVLCCYYTCCYSMLMSLGTHPFCFVRYCVVTF
ncbi:hypothetical protein ACJX0J_034087 [Zea mays]